ncbi:MAG: hypothetical protein NTW19_06300 [Planctomycetota bacterium]|nr:hypothetical protein [Planctomycetota bacterium]
MAAMAIAGWALVASIAAALPGCSNPFFFDPRVGTQAAPPDFSLEVQTEGDMPDNARTRYVLEANRRLRASRGKGAGYQSAPAAVRALEPAEFSGLYVIVRDERLIDLASPQPRSVVDAPFNAGPARVRVTITARGRTNHYVVLAADSPATDKLAARLAALAFPAPGPAPAPAPGAGTQESPRP